MKKLDLAEAADKFEMISDEHQLFYNIKTGVFEVYIDPIYSGIEMDCEKYERDNWISTPSQYDFREYDMMEEFADSVNVTPAREILFFSLEGKGAFRRFKDALLRVGLRDEWFAFKRRAYIKIAQEWCIKNGIEYIDVVEIDKPKNTKPIKSKQAVKPCKNAPKCACPKSECQNHGKCCSCVIKHREGGNLPFCLRGESNAV